MRNYSRALSSLSAMLVFLCLILFSPLRASGQTLEPKPKVARRTITPDLRATELYSDRLSLKVTLINLPGADHINSYWHAEFKVYFVPEREFQDSVKQLARNGKDRQLRPEYFPNRIPLTGGKFDKKELGTLDKRTFVSREIEFRRKIPVEHQTSFSSILVFYSIKIYDDKLRKHIYKSDVVVYPPFDTDSNKNDKLSPRSGIYLSFYVAEGGSIYWSNRKSAGETTEWRPQ
ncbi:MAG: hypothetical protein MN733_30920 [Nitrososphaera sp.]|nr:hypothetical protein [Nitrososphaera sp.]